MPLMFGNDFCTPCEPIAWIWHKGNNPIGRRPISIVDVVDVDLPEIHAVSLLSISNCSTHTVSCIEGATAHGSSMSVCKNVSSAHSAWSKMSVRVRDEGGKERGALGCQETPIMPRGERVCWSIFKLYIYVPGLFPLSSIQSSPCLHLSYSLAVYPLWWVDSTLLHAGSAWHIQGS